MSWFAQTLGDRRKRQRGGVLSGLLIVVAFLSILIGALMTEESSAFLLSRTEVARTQRQATVTSGVELAIHRLENSITPRVCAQDARGPWFLTVNGNPTAVTQTCTAIVPDPNSGGLAAGSFTVDGIHDTSLGQNQYLVSDATGVLRAYQVGSSTPRWAFPIGGGATGPPLTRNDSDGIHEDLFVPVAMSGSGCGGHCVAFLVSAGGAPTVKCTLPSDSAVNSQPSIESTSTGGDNFSHYLFFAGSGSGSLQVYYAIEMGNCGQQATASLGGSAVGSPLVFPGTVTTKKGVTTVSDDIFVLVNTGASTFLEHWRYSEINGDPILSNVGPSLDLTSVVGSMAVGYALAPGQLNPGTSLSMIVAGASGQLGMARITASSGLTYSSTLGPFSTVLSGGVSRAPYWCTCPSGTLIGVGTTNGSLYLLSSSLATVYSYSGVADGSPAINTTPRPDENGDWYFGADDGFVYDVEIPISGSQLFKAARFGPGGAILSSPIVGGDAECGDGPCVYFGSSTAGSYLTFIGETRILDIRACVSDAGGSTNCAANPRLWARVEVGQSAVIGGDGVYVMGWSYYSP